MTERRRINRRLRGAGGNLIHSVPQGDQRAICGYEPSGGGGYKQKPRHGWWSRNPPFEQVTCRKCLERLA